MLLDPTGVTLFVDCMDWDWESASGNFLLLYVVTWLLAKALAASVPERFVSSVPVEHFSKGRG